MDPDVNSSWNGDKPEGKYANFFKVGHNAVEFVIDFGQFYPGNDQAELYSRIITNPIYAKELLVTLQEAIKQYEQTFGDIRNENQSI